jgi:hypothetical protein
MVKKQHPTIFFSKLGIIMNLIHFDICSSENIVLHWPASINIFSPTSYSVKTEINTLILITIFKKIGSKENPQTQTRERSLSHK